jgi:hypothetical protein
MDVIGGGDGAGASCAVEPDHRAEELGCDDPDCQNRHEQWEDQGEFDHGLTTLVFARSTRAAMPPDLVRFHYEHIGPTVGPTWARQA